MIINIVKKLLPVTILCVLAGSLFAQSSVTGGISGKVSDPQGAVVTNATVTVTNVATSKSTTAQASDEGVFKVINLDPGTYRVEVTSGSFAPFKNESVAVEVGRVTPLDVTLSVGGTSAQVEVTAEAPVVNTNDMSRTFGFYRWESGRANHRLVDERFAERLATGVYKLWDL